MNARVFASGFLLVITCGMALSQTILTTSDISKVALNCSVLREGNFPKIVIVVRNYRNEEIFVLVSHWEIDGLFDDKDYFVGFPSDSYIVNRIHFFHRTMKKGDRISFTGEKSDFPMYRKFPKVVRLTPPKSQKFIIELGKTITDSLDIAKYWFNCQISFAYAKEWRRLESLLGEEINKAITEAENLPIVIKLVKYGKPYIFSLSDVEVDSAFSTQIHEVFDNFIVGTCK